MLTKLYPAKLDNDALQPAQTNMFDADSFLDKTAHINDQQCGRLMLALDATRGREGIWELIRQNQTTMFMAGGQKTGLLVQLAYFRGENECRVSKWLSNPQAMHHALGQIECSGTTTQFSRLLSHAAKEHSKKRLSAFVFVGDRLEEDADTLLGQASELGRQGLRTIMVQDGIDSETQNVFKAIAQATHGAHFQFDQRYPKTLEEILPASAIFATGGMRGLSVKTDETSKSLLAALKNNSTE